MTWLPPPALLPHKAKQAQQLKHGGGADGANIMGSGGEKEHKHGGAPPSPNGEGSPRNRAALGGDSFFLFFLITASRGPDSLP